MEKGEMKQQKLTEKGKKTEIAYKDGENQSQKLLQQLQT